jgi:sortase (surface protein transpeptidase)
MRNLSNGDVIEYYTAAGAYTKYVVTYVADLPPDADWAGIVSAGSADMTLITCSGVFQAAVHEYTTRRVVQARKA